MLNLDNIQLIIEEMRKLGDAQRQPFQVLLIVTLVRDIAYYIIVGLVVWALGKRMIAATKAATKEAKT